VSDGPHEDRTHDKSVHWDFDVSHAMADPSRRSERLHLWDRAIKVVLGMVGVVLVGVIAAVALLVRRPTGWAALEGLVVALAFAAVAWLRRRGWLIMDQLDASERHQRLAAAEQAESDAAARRVLADHADTGRPYGLFLRAFEVEGSRHLVELEGLETWATVQPVLGAGLIETRLQEVLGGRLPLVGVQNPTANAPYGTRGIPKLALPDEHWREVVRGLVAGADLIVLQPAGPSRGLTAELSIILDEGRETDTVVVFGKETVDAVGLSRFVLGSVGVEHSNERWLVEGPELADFPRFAVSDDLDPGTIELHPAFADLVGRVEFLNDLESTARRQAQDARLSVRTSLLHWRSGEAGDALSILQDTRRVQEEIGDRVMLVWTLLAIATVQHDLGEHVSVKTSCDEALAICDERDRIAKGRAHRIAAVSQRDAGDLGAAISSLLDAARTLSDVGSPNELAGVAQLLAELYLDRGEPSMAVEWLVDAVEQLRSVHDYHGLADALTSLGSVQLAAGDDRAATQTMTECLDLVRASPGDTELELLEPLALAVLALATARLGETEDARSRLEAARRLPVAEEYTALVSDYLAAAEQALSDRF
jgi:hypothetical protein